MRAAEELALVFLGTVSGRSDGCFTGGSGDGLRLGRTRSKNARGGCGLLAGRLCCLQTDNRFTHDRHQRAFHIGANADRVRAVGAKELQAQLGGRIGTGHRSRSNDKNRDARRLRSECETAHRTEVLGGGE